MFFPFFLLSSVFFAAAAYSARKRRGKAPEAGILPGPLKVNAAFFVLGAVLFLAVIIFLLSLTRYNSYSSNFDLAIYDQIIWNSSRGRFFASSIMGNCNSLGNHFEPVLLLLAPLYRLFADVKVLFAVQALALSSAMIPLYLTAKQKLEGRIPVLSVVAAYFLSRGIQGAGMFEFHTDCFLPLLLLYAYYFLITDRRRGTIWMCLLMLLCKENAAFLLLGLGIFALTRRKDRFFGVVLSAGAVVYWLLITNLVMPFFAGGDGTPDYKYFSWLPFGPSISDNISAFIRDPAGFFMLFFDKTRIEYYFHLLGPAGFLALLSPAHYALFMLPAGIFVLGSFGHLGLLNIMAQYSAHTVPAVFISAISGAAFLQKKLFLRFPGYKERINLILSLYLVFFAAGFYGKTSGHRMAKFVRAGKEIKAEGITAVLRTYIPPDASVTSTVNISAHLSHRRRLYLLEEMKADSNYPQWPGKEISNPPYKEDPALCGARYESDYIAAHEKFSGDEFPAVLKNVSNHGYRLIYRDDAGLVIFKKTGNN